MRSSRAERTAAMNTESRGLPDVAVIALSAPAEPMLPRPFAGTTAPQSAPTGAVAGSAEVAGRADGVLGGDVVGRDGGELVGGAGVAGPGDECGAVARGVRMTGPAPPVGLAVMVVEVLPQAAVANSATPAIIANRTPRSAQECRRMARYLPVGRDL